MNRLDETIGLIRGLTKVLQQFSGECCKKSSEIVQNSTIFEGFDKRKCSESLRNIATNRSWKSNSLRESVQKVCVVLESAKKYTEAVIFDTNTSEG